MVVKPDGGDVVLVEVEMVKLPELPECHLGDLQEVVVGEDQVLQAPLKEWGTPAFMQG